MGRRAIEVLRGLVAALGLGVAVVHLTGLGDTAPPVVTAGLTLGVYFGATLLLLLRAILIPARATAWAWIGAGLCAYSSGTAYSWVYTWDGAVLPFPSLSDVAWLTFYPLAYTGILAFLREQNPPRRILLDGAIAGFGGAAVFSILVVDVLIDPAETGGLARWIALAYPLGDALLLGTMLARMAVGVWTGPPSLLISGGFGAFIAADTGYVIMIANGTYRPGSSINLLYVLGLALLGQAAWAQPRIQPGTSDRNPLGISVVFAFGALGALLYGTRARLSITTIVLAGLTLAAVVLRTVVSIRELEAAGHVRHLEARRDPLTGLANRRAVMEHLDALLARPSPPPVALLLLDLDRFKYVNDTFGHPVGDRLLELASQRLAECTRADDVLARLGGDEFVVVLSGAHLDEDTPSLVASRIRERLSELFPIEGADISIDVSIGIARHTGGDANVLLQQADIAMYEAKRAGGGHAFFNSRLTPPVPPILAER
ncbi:GGDEF domain-containing protein [Actinoplanes couchii]|uniref:GGDEF domain-containing protein n=1 Tax=Actinoplanes couchii TaxID=403638 RepID=A0ABQ3XEA3_9ACTN|nr:GGDEF domain-containing protein [Actinoplanes couchii]MDR6317299.1 diguanylate cyclase (GGDEF)-like protein [Actinoplanes couchii]GID56793.1 hypothetical protein Aco03nite_051970 [Actinoplanes couchii]